MITIDEKPRLLIHAIGNPSRGDDALGCAFLEMLEPWLCKECFSHIHMQKTFQLNIEDAYEMSGYDIVVIVDASENLTEEWSLTKITPEIVDEYSSHSISPSTVLNLCGELYGKFPETYLLEIKGYQWEIGERLSEQAEKNLWKAFGQFREMTKQWYHNPEEAV
ncbi:MAG: hydrogenase maturation protease [Bacteroidetes bacterium]|nr:hydrogenase maturation protease [Bacteroidota bacterium]